MAAVRPASRTTDERSEQPPEPKLGLILPIIRPWGYEQQFWSSLVFGSATRETDAFNLFTRVCENCLFLCRSLHGIPDSTAGHIRQQCERHLTLAVLHVALKVLAPRVYARCRWIIVVHLRLYNFLGTMAFYLSARNILAAGLHIGYVDSILMYQVVQGNVTFATARALFIATGCVFPFLHSLPPVLPFIPELLLQLVYLYLSAAYIAPVIADAFGAPRFSAGTQQLCDALSHAMPAPAALLSPAPASGPDAGVCGAQRAWVLVLFFQLFVGFTLPIYICYTYEHCLKLRFLRQLRGTGTSTTLRQQQPLRPTATTAPVAQQQQQQQQRAPPDVQPCPSSPPAPPRRRPFTTQLLKAQRSVVSVLKALTWQHTPVGSAACVPQVVCKFLQLLRSCLHHVTALYLLAALCWQLVVALQVPLARRVRLLTFQDGYREWYWELMCGTDQPCCPI